MHERWKAMTQAWYAISVWKTIQEAKDQGMRQLDLGHSDLDTAGLIQFKERLGASRLDLKYYRLASSGKAPSAWRMASDA